MIDVVITCYLETVWKDFLAPTESRNSVSHRLSAAGALSHHPVTRSMCSPDSEVRCASPTGSPITDLLTSMNDSTFD